MNFGEGIFGKVGFLINRTVMDELHYECVVCFKGAYPLEKQTKRGFFFSAGPARLD